MGINAIHTRTLGSWLQTLGYAPSTIYATEHYTSDFLHYLETLGVTSLEAVRPAMVDSYHQHLQTRNSKRSGGSLSNNYITSNINALKRLAKYLRETGQTTLEVPIKTVQDKYTTRNILTTGEVRALYQACGNNTLGIRDRAILGIYYGCGLRRSEGVSLNVADILLKGKRVHVTSGKGYKERYVPVTGAVIEDLENYIHTAREEIQDLKPGKNEALFLSMQARRMCGTTILERIHKLAHDANIHKEVGLHVLRHSIATHLLQSGLTLEEVSQFLGHSSLESTQVYTHVANE